MSETKELSIAELKDMVLDYLRDEFADDPDCGERNLCDIAAGFSTSAKVLQALHELEAEGDVIHTGPSEKPHFDMWQAVPGRHTWEDDDDASDTITELRRQIAALTQRAEQAERIVADNRLADLTVPLRDYNELSKNALDLDAEWRAKLTDAESELKRIEAEKLRLIEFILNEAIVAHRKCVDVSTLDGNFQLGRHGGLMWAYNAVCHSSLLAQPSDAKEAEGE